MMTSKTRQPRGLKAATFTVRVVAVAMLFLFFPFFISALPGIHHWHPGGAVLAKGESGGDGGSDGDSDGSDGGEGGDSDGDGSDGGEGDDGGDEGGDEGGDDGGDEGDTGGGGNGGVGNSGSGKDGSAINQSRARAASSAARASGARQVSISQRGIEVVYNNGGRAEIRNGTYTFRGRSGQVMVRRRANGTDVALLKSTVKGLSFESLKASQWSAVRPVRVAISRSQISVVYSNGWQELVRNRQYTLSDNLGRAVVKRPATRADRRRLEKIAN